MNREKQTRISIIATILRLIILSRPEWAFIFSQVALMVGLLYQLPMESLIIGPISIFLFAMGHFSLNGYYDKHSDAINPRGLSLRNPLNGDKVLNQKNVIIILLPVLPGLSLYSHQSGLCS